MTAAIELHPEDMSIELYMEKLPGAKGHKATLEHLVEKINRLPENGESELIKLWWRYLTIANSENNALAIQGWLNAVWLAVHATGFLLPLATSRHQATKLLNNVNRPKGTAKQQANGIARMGYLVAAITSYREKFHDGGFRGCLAWLKCQPAYHKDGKICGYRCGMNGKESTAERHIREILNGLGKGSTD